MAFNASWTIWRRTSPLTMATVDFAAVSRVKVSGGVFGPAEALHAVPLLRRLEERGALTASPGLLAGEPAGKSLLRRS